MIILRSPSQNKEVLTSDPGQAAAKHAHAPCIDMPRNNHGTTKVKKGIPISISSVSSKPRYCRFSFFTADHFNFLTPGKFPDSTCMFFVFAMVFFLEINIPKYHREKSRLVNGFDVACCIVIIHQEHILVVGNVSHVE